MDDRDAPKKEDPKKKALMNELRANIAKAKESFARVAPLLRQIEKMRQGAPVNYVEIEFMNCLKREGLALEGRTLDKNKLATNIRFSAN
jgi:hypothetical protein